MKRSTILPILTVALAAVAAKRYNQRPIGHVPAPSYYKDSNKASRQLQLDFGPEFYNPSLDFDGQQAKPDLFTVVRQDIPEDYDEGRASAAAAYEAWMADYNKYGSWGRRRAYNPDVVVDIATGDEYDPETTFEIYGRPIISRDDPQQMEVITGEDLANLTTTIEAYQAKAKKLGWELWLYEDGYEVEYLG